MDTLIEKKTLSVKAFFDSLFFSTIHGGCQVAVWKKPRQPLVEVVIDHKGEINRVTPDLEELSPGFILHPFAEDKDKKAIYISAESYFAVDISEDAVSETEIPESLLKQWQKEGDRTSHELRSLLANSLPSKREVAPAATSKESFMKMVEAGVRSIENGELYKVVVSKVKEHPLDSAFDLAETFLKLCRSYPNSFINFFHIPRIGVWIGASPEVLIKTKDSQFYTMALAGTQRAKGDNPLKTAAWTQKEIEEQALVGRYIVSCFKKIRLREYDEIGPKTSMAGNLLHLKSDFVVDMDATGFPRLGSVMLDLLHPTSAVCGMPKDKAMDFIHQHEGFDRSFFAGYLGPVNIGGETSLFVNLRCAQILADSAILYAGAGITEDSVPEEEWEETELKCDIIGKHLNNPTIS